MRRLLAMTTTAAVVMAGSVAAQTVAPAAAHAAGATYYRPADGVLHLAGHGFGHGHGMSQWGAYGGAESGKTYQQILAWYFNNAPLATVSGNIRVQITSDGRNGDGTYDVRVKPASGLTAVDGAGNTLTLPAKNDAGTAYDLYRAVLLTDGTFRVQAHAGSTWTSLAPAAAGSTATSWTKWVRLSAAGGVLDLVRTDGSTERYREILELDETSAKTGVTVNRLSLEHYLLGVVSSEMPCSWTPTVNGTKRLDALESQAVAARSYAAWRRQHPRSSQVDIVDNTYDQAYHGYSAESTAITTCPWTNSDGTKTSASAAAVAATAGQVMVDGNGDPIFAQYSASNGGFETAGGQAYLPSRPDAWDGVPTDAWSSHTWSGVSITAGQIEGAYRSTGRFASLTVNSREQLSGGDQNGNTVHEEWGGRVAGLTITGSAGSVTTTGASFAAALGLESPWFTVVVQRPAAPASVSAQPGDAQATVRWAAPSTDGGGGIRSYTITASPSIPPVTVSGASRSAVITGLANDRAYVFSVAATNSAGTGGSASAPAVAPSARVVFHPLRAARVVDTRVKGGAIGAGAVRSVAVTGVAGIPSSGVVDVAVDVAAVDETATSSLSVYPHGGSRPPTPQLTWTKALRVNTLVPVKVGWGGKIDLRNNSAGTTQVVVDVEGYFTSASTAGDVLTAATPYRLFDSRGHAPVAGGTTRTVAVAGRGGVPTGATAVVVQLKAVRPARRDNVRVWPAGSKRPSPYELYAAPNRTTTATAVVPLTSTGAIAVSPLSTTHLVVTLQGWFTTASTPAAGVASLLTPAHRILSATVAAGATKTVSGGLPAGAAAALVTVTGLGPAGGSVYVCAAGARVPPMPAMQLYGAWATTSQLTPVGAGGALVVHNGGNRAVRVRVDVSGWA